MLKWTYKLRRGLFFMWSEDEVWKRYPEFDWVQASNLGKVRTVDRYVSDGRGSRRLVKGLVLKQRHREDGYCDVQLSIKGKNVNRKVHRIVAGSFIKNPDNLPQVNHKNCVRDDNRVENLEWCSCEYNRQYREKYGISTTEILGHPLFAVNLKTQKILQFKSHEEAARELNIDSASVCRVVKGKLNYAGDYWFTENKKEITKERLQSIKDNIRFQGGVIAVNLETLEVLRFKSQMEASRQLGVYHSSINMVARGKLNQTKGYWFVYADENTVEKTRTKFGDEVANRVAKLMESE